MNGTFLSEIINEILPNKFLEGHVATKMQAAFFSRAILTQFRSTTDANAKNRAERLTKAVAANDAKGVAENQPYTAGEIRKLFAEYEVTPRGEEGLSGLEKLQLQMAWRYWTARVDQHNKLVAAGQDGLIPSRKGKAVKIDERPRKSETLKGDALEAAQDVFDSERLAFKTALLGKEPHASAIRVMVDAELAARKAEKVAPAAAADAASVGVGDL